MGRDNRAVDHPGEAPVTYAETSFRKFRNTDDGASPHAPGPEYAMLQLILGTVVFALAAAAIGMFAMVGQLTSQVHDPAAGAPVPDVPPRPLPEARLGAEPDQWPPELADVPQQPLAHVVVFGATCHSCHRIASGATGSLDILTPRPAIVISCATTQRGAQFVEGHPAVASYPYALDVGGEWLRANFGVGTSPTILVFTHGRLRSAYTFTSASTLADLPAAEVPQGAGR